MRYSVHSTSNWIKPACIAWDCENSLIWIFLPQTYFVRQDHNCSPGPSSRQRSAPRRPVAVRQKRWCDGLWRRESQYHRHSGLGSSQFSSWWTHSGDLWCCSLLNTAATACRSLYHGEEVSGEWGPEPSWPRCTMWTWRGGEGDRGEHGEQCEHGGRVWGWPGDCRERVAARPQWTLWTYSEGLVSHARKWFLRGVVSDGRDNWSVVTELETGDMYRAGSRSLIS